MQRRVVGSLLAVALACSGCRTVAAVTAGGAVVGGAIGYSVDNKGYDVAAGALIGAGAALVVLGGVLLWLVNDATKNGPYRSGMTR
jgi:hypothetical protein